MPSANIHRRRRQWDYGKPDQHHKKHFPYRDGTYNWPQRSLLKIKTNGTNDHTHDYHGMQPDQARFEKFKDGYFIPPVIISIPDDKAGEDKEKIYRKVSMIDDLVERA